MLPDLISVIITLTNPEPVSFPYYQGRAIKAAFLSWIEDKDPNLSTKVHGSDDIDDNDNKLRQYTVSNLYTQSNRKTDRVFLKSHSKTWFRITSTSTELTRFILNELLNELPNKPITLSNSDFQILDVTWNPDNHPWAGGTSYNNLIRDGLLGDTHHQFPVHFASPTSFHSHGVYLPLPLPELVIRYWMLKWNEYAPMHFPESLLENLQGTMGISSFKMRSEFVRYGEATFRGGIGDCTFTIINHDPFWQQVLNGLSAFAFYAGTGIKTTMGLGQTRRMDLDDYRAL